jgi:hypothetical protein
MKYQYIIAGNIDQYRNWAADKMSVNHFLYVSGPDMLRGIENPHGIFIGTWYERKDIYDILLNLLTASRVENPEIRKAIKYYEDKQYERTN